VPERKLNNKYLSTNQANIKEVLGNLFLYQILVRLEARFGNKIKRKNAYVYLSQLHHLSKQESKIVLKLLEELGFVKNTKRALVILKNKEERI
jgi:hypothetical protein